ncbi:ribonuclease E inhibitor RraB [Thalassotalea aquiviva]|uniref:ribonuclease E inhibitor RraB n=1 Tax=Thalassotalea aquiviva TaxID=3242415 RepID=UPI00352A657A
MSLPNDETGSVLAEMIEAGIDLAQPMRVEYFQLFEQEQNARALAEHIKQTMPDVVVKVHPDQTPQVWDVDCTLVMVPSYDNIVQKEQEFEKLARQFDGYNDGWGVQIDD